MADLGSALWLTVFACR